MAATYSDLRTTGMPYDVAFPWIPSERMDWVRPFYERQYSWADWRARWADADPDDPALDAHVHAVRRLTGPGQKRILELGSGTGHVSAALANAGHEVVALELLDELVENIRRLAEDVRTGSLEAICGDFYEVDVAGHFDVVAYFDGFGIGTDDDQRRLLSRIALWLAPHGAALIDVFSPAYWVKASKAKEEFPPGSDVWYRDRFDPEGSRMIEDMWRRSDEDDVVSQTLRCYSPADLRLLLDGPTCGWRKSNRTPMSPTRRDVRWTRRCCTSPASFVGPIPRWRPS